MTANLIEVFNKGKIDLAVTYVQPPTDPDHDPAAHVKRVEVKPGDIVEHEHGIVLKAHHSQNLLGVFIPWRMIMGIDFLREYNESTGQYI